MASTVKPQEEMDLAEIVKLIEAEEDTGEDIIEELSEEDIKDIYNNLTTEDKKWFKAILKIPPPIFWCFWRTHAFLLHGKASDI